jgi:hypothetical protein
VWDDPSAADVIPSFPYVPIHESAYAAALPVCGMMDEESHETSPVGKYFHWGARTGWVMPAGVVWRAISAGGGGWGDPLQRSPSDVLKDVRDGYVSIEGALRDYGVVVLGDPVFDPEGITIDSDATAVVRRRRSEKGSQHAVTSMNAGLAGTTVASAVGGVAEERLEVPCPECGSPELRRYVVLAEAGWVKVTKCRQCLRSTLREPWKRLGWVDLLEDDILP